MSFSTIAKKNSNRSSFVFFISINCKVSKGNSSYETILEKIRRKKGSQGGRFFFLKKREVTKWTRIQET
jgi:hypothetical protein